MNEQNFNSQTPASLIKLIKKANMVEEFGEWVPQLEAGSTIITYVMVLEWMQIVRNKKNKIRSETLGYSLLRGCRSLTYHIVTVEETETVIQNQIIEQQMHYQMIEDQLHLFERFN